MSVILNGNTYSNSMFTGLGYVALFPDPVFDDMLAELQIWLTNVTAQAVAAAASASTAAAQAVIATAAAATAQTAAATLQSTSSSSLLVGSGSKSFTMGTAKAFIPGILIRVARTSDAANTWMLGIITAYNSGTGAAVITVGSSSGTNYNGSGTFTDWTISFAAAIGANGANGTNADNSLGILSFLG